MTKCPEARAIAHNETVSEIPLNMTLRFMCLLVCFMKNKIRKSGEAVIVLIGDE